jgi:SH3-like domain-containing protein
MAKKRLEKSQVLILLPVLLAAISANLFFASGVSAQSDSDPQSRPRFVSLRSEPVNMREGPSTEHAIKWVYHRKGLPMQVLTEYDVWRRVRDVDGEVGWIHVSLLTNERTAIIIGSGYAMARADDQPDASVLAEVEPGVVGTIETCGPLACRLDFSGIEGWVDRSRLWGVYADERL